jgi:hypothetical protein
MQAHKTLRRSTGEKVELLRLTALVPILLSGGRLVVVNEQFSVPPLTAARLVGSGKAHACLWQGSREARLLREALARRGEVRRGAG